MDLESSEHDDAVVYVNYEPRKEGDISGADSKYGVIVSISEGLGTTVYCQFPSRFL